MGNLSVGNKGNNKMNIQEHIKAILKELGEDPSREGLLDTPKRVEKAYKEWFKGYQKPDFNVAAFKTKYDGIVARTKIPFQSFCEHHMSRYSGFIDFAYIPNGYVVGLSKIPRILQHYSSKLTIQEELTEDLLDKFYELFPKAPKGAMIIITARHSCESTRGIKVDAPTITSSIRGVFQDLDTKTEALNLINKNNV